MTVLSGFMRRSMRQVGTTSETVPSAPIFRIAAVSGTPGASSGAPVPIHTPLATYTSPSNNAKWPPAVVSWPIDTEGSSATTLCVPSGAKRTTWAVSP